MDLVLRGVGKRFGGVRAVHDLAFTVAARSIFGLIGPNGAGKSTVFNLITGIQPSDAGSIRFGGHDLAGLSPARVAGLGIARTFQNIRVFAQLTVLENLLVAGEAGTRAPLFSALLRGRSHLAAEDAKRLHALELLRVFDLETSADAPATSLPYGAQRRLEIARAMMTTPKLLLLDEPAAGMNSGEADGLRTQIRWLRDTFGLSVALVEHNMSVVLGVCEEVHVLDHGETIAQGSPDEIKTNPHVIAAYLGEEDDAVPA